MKFTTPEAGIAYEKEKRKKLMISLLVGGILVIGLIYVFKTSLVKAK